MSFGLKNTSATYQRAIKAFFKRLLNKNVEAYVDDVVVKTRTSDTLTVILKRLSHIYGSSSGSSTQQVRLRRTIRDTAQLHH
jgi:hypothetical protein